jgi:hypothetical protein
MGFEVVVTSIYFSDVTARAEGFFESALEHPAHHGFNGFNNCLNWLESRSLDRYLYKSILNLSQL